MSLYAGQVTGEAVTAAVAETIIMVATSTSIRAKIRRWGVSFNGTDVTDAPVQVQLMRFTSNGSSSTGVPVKMDTSDVPALSAIRTAFTAEPTTSDVLETHFVSPAGGNLIETYFDDAPVVEVSGRIGIRVLANDAVNVSAFIHFEE